MIRLSIIEHVKTNRMLDLEVRSSCAVKHLFPFVGILQEDFYFVHNGKITSKESVLVDGGIYHAVPRLIGGKGGFGSMLRTLGAQIEKTTNREACRDLSGRRMRDINNEKKLQDWIGKEADREREREEQRRLRKERRRQAPRHVFDDPRYAEQKSKVIENLDDAVQQGLKRTLLGGGSEDPAAVAKKLKAPSAAATASSSKGAAAEWLTCFDGASSFSDSDSSDHGQCDTETQPSSTVRNTAVSDGDSSTTGEVDNERMHVSLNSEPRVDVPHTQVVATEDLQTSSSTNKAGDAARICHTANEGDAVVAAPGDFVESQQCSELGLAFVLRAQDAAVTTDPVDKEAKGVPVDTTHVEEVLLSCTAAEQLEPLGLDALKSALTARGMKCGGTLQERARRLFAVRGLAVIDIDPKLLAGPGTASHKKNVANR